MHLFSDRGPSFTKELCTYVFAQRIRLVLHFDDDITLEKDALNKMILFWNNAENHRENLWRVPHSI